MARGIPRFPMEKFDPPETFYWGAEIDRETALALRRNRFFTGEPCKWGHVAERWCLSRRCVECVKRSHRTEEYREYATPMERAWVAANPDKVDESNAQRRAKKAALPVKSEARREGVKRHWAERRKLASIA